MIIKVGLACVNNDAKNETTVQLNQLATITDFSCTFFLKVVDELSLPVF